MRMAQIMVPWVSCALLLAHEASAAVLGVAPGSQSRYAGSTFRCLNGQGASLPLQAVNDQFCDCPDGSDEPGTGACAGSEETLFYCVNTGSTPRQLYASRVGDGICDCCDGSDEQVLASRSPVLACPNTCAEQGRREKEELQKRIEASSDMEQWRREMEQLKGELPALEKDFQAAQAEAEAERKAKKEAEEAAVAKCDPACRWRQTGGCSPTGEREEKQDKACNVTIPLGASGFCDCNGNGIKEDSEPGYDCKTTPGKCCRACQDPLPTEKPVTADAVASTGDTAKTEEKQVSEYAKWMEGAQESLDTANAEAAKEAPQVSEYTKWMDGAEEKVAGKDGAKPSAPAAPTETAAAAEGAAAAAAPSAVDREREARKKVNENKDKTKELQGKLDAVSGEHLGYASLAGRTLTKHVGEFDYKVAFFDNAKQGFTSLGKWGKWTGSRSGAFENGATCWEGPARRLDVKFECGVEEALVDVYEPSRCVYEASVVHPGACEPAELERLSTGNLLIGPRDEL